VKLRYGEGTVTERGGRFRAMWVGVDGRRKSRTFATRQQAEAHLLDVSSGKRRRSYVDPSQMTLGEAADDWLERGAGRWSGGTYATYRQRIEKHLLPVLGRQKVVDLTTHRLQAWADRLALAPNTAASCLTAVSGILSDCVRLGVIERNPAAGVRLAPARKQERQVWDADAARRVLAHVRGDAKLHALYQVALSTGMRPGELRALRWADIDFEQGTVTVRRTVAKSDGGGYTVREATKSGRVRVVPVPRPCVAALRVWRLQHPAPYIFGTADHALKATTLERWHKRVVEATGVAPITPHGMRHSAAGIMIANGVNMKVVSEMLGHTSIKITMDTYVHVDLTMKQVATDILERALFVEDANQEDGATPSVPPRSSRYGR